LQNDIKIDTTDQYTVNIKELQGIHIGGSTSFKKQE